VYLRTMVPLAGRVLSNASAYRYLAASIECLPDPAVMLAEMASHGFVELSARPLSGGVVTLFSGQKLGCRR
jgi:demethylmenaquinone methyltransferase/2-methoxy-6-polyprenyl-1,4-benzoquinol methylase